MSDGPSRREGFHQAQRLLRLIWPGAAETPTEEQLGLMQLYWSLHGTLQLDEATTVRAIAWLKPQPGKLISLADLRYLSVAPPVDVALDLITLQEVSTQSTPSVMVVLYHWDEILRRIQAECYEPDVDAADAGRAGSGDSPPVPD